MLTRTGKLIVAGGIVGIVLVVFGIIVEHVPSMVMKKSVPIVDREESKTFPGWSNPSLPIFMNFHFFNVTNVAEVMTGAKPVLQELGPYVYRERREKVNIVFNEDKTEVTYNEKIWFHFESDLSTGTQDDLVSVYNLPYLTVINSLMIASATNRKAKVATIFLNGKINANKIPLFEYRTVEEYLWGFESRILKLLRAQAKFREKIPSNDFGLFKDRNGTEGPQMTIATGLSSLDDLAQVREFKGNSSLPYWYSDCANAINGTDGSMFHPGVKKDETLYMFSPDLCRSLYAEFKGEEVIHGLNTYHFSPSTDVFESPDVVPSNVDFCYPDGEKKSCLGKGLMWVTKCKKNAPLVVSPPHLLGVDPAISGNVVGLKPDPSIHITKLNIEPNTGFLLAAKKRLQYNAYVIGEKGQAIYKSMKKQIVLPLFWVEEGVEAPPAFADKIRRVPKLIATCHNIMLATVAIGALVLLGCLIAAFVYNDRVFDRQASLHTAEMKQVPTQEKDDPYENGKYKASQVA